MIKITMREFSHHVSGYVRRAEQGEKVVITKRNKPSVQLSHYRENVSSPSWKSTFVPVPIKGEPLSQTVIKMRKDR